MFPNLLPTLLASLAVASSVVGINILLINDDSWASANIRATYQSLKEHGHKVILVAPAVNQSGRGGTVVFPTTNITAPGGEFGSIPVGAPYFGHDLQDSNIWYFNGTPAATALFALDVIIPKHFSGYPIDLVVSGPNEGQNNGPFLYTLSGTIGAAYASVERGIPAVAFSAGNGTHRSFTTLTDDPFDPATLAAKVVSHLVAGLADGVDTEKDRLLPLGLGINVNIPILDSDCSCPPFVHTRLTGGAIIDGVVIDETTGFPTYKNLVAPGLNTCVPSDCRLPGETTVSAKCQTAVSIFSVDYDAPIAESSPVVEQLHKIFEA